MLILGLNGGADSVFDSGFGLSKNAYHDTASVIIQDGVVIAGIEEERLIRIKHTNKAWVLSVQFCLGEANKNLADIDHIVVYFNQDVLNRMLKQEQLNNPLLIEIGTPHKLFEHLFFREFGFCLKENQLVFVDHHTTHAATAYYMSGFSDSLVLTIDGLGDEVASNVIDVRNKRFDYLLSKPASDSLGLLYWEVIRFLGYGHFDEYKVMGLSPYGSSETYKEEFRRLYTLLPDGDYSLHRDRITELFNILTPRNKDAVFSQIHMDIAAALQEALETIVFHVLCHYQKLTGHTRLVISGGVGQNSSMNGKILYSGLFEEVFVPSFAGDSGCAYGAAAYVAHQLRPDLPFKKVTHAYWGTAINDGEEADSLAPWREFVTVEKMADRSEQVSDLIVEGAVIGWVQGRSEFGPRALGNRSIIADPRVGSHKETINAMIKMRESYRPFAPSVLVERVRDFFEVPGKQEDFPFMSFVLNVRPEWREQLPAITHVDGSARLQTVDKGDNPRYWELIEIFGRKTGIPILLNTSFNNNAEPIVDSIDDAVVCYLTSGLNYLVVGDYLVTKKDWGNEQLATLIVTLPKAAVLNREDRYINYTERGLSHFLTWNYDTSRRYPLSDIWYQVLRQADGFRTLQQLMTDLGFEDEQQNQVYEELPILWSDRLIILHPGSIAI